MPLEGPQYPVNLVVRGHRCLVVGGGRVALGKVQGLLAADALVTVVAPEVVGELDHLDGVVVERRAYRPGEVAGYRLVVTATNDAAVNHRVFLDGEEAGVWVNSADDPANCSFILPAVVRRGPIMVTVGTSGHSPALATWLRRHIERELDASFTTLLDLLAERRAALRAEGAGTEGLSWQQVLDGGMLELVREGRIDEARERLRCL